MMTKLILFLMLLLTNNACQQRAEHILYKTKPSVVIDEKPILPTFNSISENIFDKKNGCKDCHVEGGKVKDILLDYKSLLNSPRELVLPENSEESGLYISVARNDKKKMPPLDKGYKALTNEELDAIKTWIDNGAKE